MGIRLRKSKTGTNRHFDFAGLAAQIADLLTGLERIQAIEKVLKTHLEQALQRASTTAALVRMRSSGLDRVYGGIGLRGRLPWDLGVLQAVVVNDDELLLSTAECRQVFPQSRHMEPGAS